MPKRCYGCKETKADTEFYKDRGQPDGTEQRCKTCSLARANARRAKPGMRESILGRAKARRKSVIDRYGGACACCGEREYGFLAIDHIDGNGAEHRRTDPSACAIVLWLVRNNFPDGFRVLCHNCNMARGIYGYCPHDRERDKVAS